MRSAQTKRPEPTAMRTFLTEWSGTIVAMVIAAVLLSMLIK